MRKKKNLKGEDMNDNIVEKYREVNIQHPKFTEIKKEMKLWLKI